MRLGSSSWGVLLASTALALWFGGCELNPQPEVPAGSDDSGLGGSGNTNAGGTGALGSGATGGIGNGGTAATDGALSGCAPGCGEGKLCNSGDCVDDPCDPNSCDADQACKPNADFTASNCYQSCAGVSCSGGQSCVDGQCKSNECGGSCAANEVCQPELDGGYGCGVNPCDTDAAPSCPSGESCDPLTGACSVDPCNGVKCPEGQGCNRGQCTYQDDAGPAGDAG